MTAVSGTELDKRNNRENNEKHNKENTNNELQIATIDGKAFPFQTNETILSFARRHLGERYIPTLCDDSRLTPYGACRICCVGVALKKDGPSKVMASCHTPLSSGMHIQTQSPEIQKLRKNIIELLLTDHPLDCLTCEVNGNCELQTVAASVGIREVRYAKGANHLDKQKDTSHPYLRMDLTKCINCSRCIRACDEIQGDFVLNMGGRGFESQIIKDTDLPFGASSCVSCGACVETCPTAAISDRFHSKAVEATRKVRTICSYCGVGCNLEVSLRDCEVLSIRAPWNAEVNQGHTCLKGRYAFRFYNHPDRLKSPLLKKEGQLVPVTWDEAYSFIAEKLLKIRDHLGADAIAGISSSRCTNEENFLMQKFMRAVIGTNNIDCCARVCHSPTALGMQRAFGTGAATNSIADLQYADLILVIGANPTVAHPVTGAKIKQQIMKGKALIVIDPVLTDLAKLADFHLQLRPGTNVALLNLFLYYIIEAGLVDEEFVKQRCENFETFKGQICQINIDEMELITGVDRTLVRAAAIAFGEAPSAMSFHGLGVTEHSQGSKTVMLIADLAMMTGNIGRSGVGVNPLRGQNNVQGAADMGCQPHQGAGYFDVTDADNQDFYAKAYDCEVPTTVGLKAPQMVDAAKAGQLKALWIMGEDIAQTDPNSQHVIESLEALELLIVQEIFLSETAKLADVVLPATSFLEKSGTFTNGERRVQRVMAAIDPLPGTRTDGQIIVDIMNRLGYAQADFTHTEVLKEIAGIVPFFAGITWEGLGENGLQWPVSTDGLDTPILHTKTFKNGKGKFHFFSFAETQELLDNKDQFP